MKVLFAGLLFGLLISLSGHSVGAEDYSIPAEPPFLKLNPFTQAKQELGEMLFFEPRLSGDNSLSCASCHQPDRAYEDGLSSARGVDGRQGRRSTPSLANIAFAQALTWDGRVALPEGAVLGPISSETEMAEDLDSLVVELAAIPEIAGAFERAYPGEGVTLGGVSAAVAIYLRTRVSASSPFDAWRAGDAAAVSESAKRGFDLFTGKAGCQDCHRGWRFTDDTFHDIGLAISDDLGRAGLLDEDERADPENVKDFYAFRTPGLRDIAIRSPYMHDGSLKRLEDVIDHYADEVRMRESLSPRLRPIDLSAVERADLVAFLNSLTGGMTP
ncbi:MAG: cytochrome-c peroxidase [Magnetovibrionaceae bacterium]